MPIRILLAPNNFTKGVWVDLPDSVESIKKRVRDMYADESIDGFAVVDYYAPFKIERGVPVNLGRLNEIVIRFEELPKIIKNNLDTLTRFETVEEIIENKGENYTFIEGIDSHEELAKYLIDKEYGGIEQLPLDVLRKFFDYRSFGLDYDCGYLAEIIEGGYMICKKFKTR